MERARIDELIHREMAERKIPGLSAVVVRRDRPHDFLSYGVANLELGVATSERSVYALASVTKQFTAAGVMALVEDGLIDVDQLLMRYLPEMPKVWDSLRVHHLLAHTSGIPSFNGLPEFAAMVRQDRTPGDLLQLIRDLPLDFQSGEKCHYSNSNYLLLGLLISHINGTTYADFMHRRFFEPLGMKDTRMNDWAAIIPNRVAGYSERDDFALRNAPYYAAAYPYAAGGLLSSTTDMAIWMTSLLEGRAISPKSIEAMWTAQKLSNGNVCDYGFGWRIDQLNGRKWVGHTGGIEGFSSCIFCYPDEFTGVVVLSNHEQGAVATIARQLADLYVAQM